MEKKEKYYDNGTEFDFISNSSELSEKTPSELKKLVLEVIKAKPYVLDWEEITRRYHDYLDIYKWINTEEFAFYYVLNYSIVNEFAQNNIIKEAMFLDLRTELMT